MKFFLITRKESTVDGRPCFAGDDVCLVASSDLRNIDRVSQPWNEHATDGSSSKKRIQRLCGRVGVIWI